MSEDVCEQLLALGLVLGILLFGHLVVLLDIERSRRCRRRRVAMGA